MQVKVKIPAKITPSEPEYGRFGVHDIQKSACQYFGINRVDLVGARRSSSAVLPRHVAMWACRTLLPTSYPVIGRLFGGRDHSSIIHGVHKIERAIESNDECGEVATRFLAALKQAFKIEDEWHDL